MKRKVATRKQIPLIRIPTSCADVNLFPASSETKFGAIKTVTTYIYDAINMIEIEMSKAPAHSVLRLLVNIGFE